MWLVCPKQESEMGKNFFDSGKFQEILEKLEATKKDKFQVVQKKDTVRFVVQEIPDIQGAFQYLKELAMSELHA
jgi:transcription-repair coupling factor (superfamily II helicase)